jgi:hypothetical protein
MDENAGKREKKFPNFIKITSKYKYFEAFSKKKLKCDMMIPPTLIVDNGFLFDIKRIRF